MRHIFIALLILTFAACADDETPDRQRQDQPDATPDLALDQQPDAQEVPDAELPDATPDLDEQPDLAPDAPPDMRVCACDVANECCDGCDIITPHTCASPAGECKVAACDPSSGCSTVNAPDGTRCAANAGLCQAGACVPDPSCECRDDDGPCCQGCRFVAAGTLCQENWTVATCSMGGAGPIKAERRGDIQCTGRRADCEVLDNLSNYRSTYRSLLCGNANIAICTPGEGVDYEACGVRP